MNTEKQRTNGNKKNIVLLAVFLALSVAVIAGIFWYTQNKTNFQQQSTEEFTSSTFVMDTLVTQQAYGTNANKAMEEVNVAFAEYQDRLSLFEQDSEIAKINSSAGGNGVEVSPKTVELLQQAKELSAQSGNTFAISIAPLSTAWGITTDHPRALSQTEIDALLPLVDDTKIEITGNVVTLPEKGMGIDLGGIAKGAACSIAQEIYEKNNVESALLSIGGNIYVKGVLPSGKPYRVGFRDPNNGENSYIASFTMQDEVIAVSGGYERYFDADGKRYIHIIDPRTGWPAESDIVSVGAITKDGAEADYYSTTLFVLGKEKTLEYMKNGLKVIMLDANNTLYVSASLKDDFKLNESSEGKYTVEFVEMEA